MKRDLWQEVSADEPCPVCKKAGWCRRSPNGSMVACRRESNGAAKTKRYKDGSEAFVHIVRDDRSLGDNGRNKAKRAQKTKGATPTSSDGPMLQVPTTSANAQDTEGKRDAGYRCLLAKLPLSPDHRDNLKQRGLSDTDIDAGGYRTMPANGRGSAIKQVVAELGMDFPAVPGFVIGEQGPRIASPSGLLVPVRDLAGQIVALKVRADNPMPRQPKYLYLSSVKYAGPGPGSPAHCPAGVCGPVELIRITEGELKADVAYRLSGVPTLSFPGVASWHVVLPMLQALECKTVRVAFDADAGTNNHVAVALRNCCQELQATGFAIELERWPAQAGKGIDDVLKAGRGADIEILAGAAALAAAEEMVAAGEVDDAPPVADKGERKSQATLLVELAAATELWHTTGQGIAYATLPVVDHWEHWPVRSATFRRWLGRQFFVQHGKAPGSQALHDAINVLEGQAIFEGPEHHVFVRVAGDGDKLYLDLANETWQVVEIDANGWRILNASPVRFRRAKAMMPLPMPTAGGNISELRRFVNVDADGWPLLLGWLVAAFRPTGPYPVLILHGEQGSAKSTTARTLRSVIDPNAALLRCEPREPRDLMIAAHNGLVIALDNLSVVPNWLSDALCRLATGGGFATRTLYENDEETIFDSMRPAILTGIEELANRSDLLDRSMILQLPRIPDAKRRTEAEHWREFQQAHGRILGAVLDAVSAAMRNLPTTHIEGLPRMADFALWATAAERGLGLQSGEFLLAYRGNRDIANESALDSSPVAKYVLKVAEGGEWGGTPGELLEHIETVASDGEKRLKSWPKNPRSLSGALKRLAPNLRAAGVEVEFGHEGRGSQKRRNVSVRKSADSGVPCAPSVPNWEKTVFCGNGEDASGLSGDEKRPSGDAAGTQTTANVNPIGAKVGTQGDDGDAKSQPRSGRVRATI